MLFRRTAAIVLGLAGLYAALGLLLTAATFDHTLANARRLDQQFHQTADAIETFKRSRSRLPNEEELGKLLPVRPRNAYAITLSPGGFERCYKDSGVYDRVGSTSYVLAAWRGEWWECYAPSKGRTTLALTPEDFTMTGSVKIDRLALSAFVMLSLGAAIRLWTRRSGPSQF